jgi:predicted nucleic acid-binding protein
VRVLLDTNVWQYLVERDAVNELRRATRARGWQVVVAPSVVYELLAIATRSHEEGSSRPSRAEPGFD